MTGISFMGFVGANCYLACIGKPMVEPGAMVSIITAVVLSYFNKTATPAVTPDPVPETTATVTVSPPVVVTTEAPKA